MKKGTAYDILWLSFQWTPDILKTLCWNVWKLCLHQLQFADFFFPPPPSPFFSPLISPQTLWKQSHPAEMIKEAGIHLDTTPSHLASKGCSHWMDRLKNIAAMLDTDQHSHSIIFSLMIAHKCFWLLHLAPQMMEVVVCIHPYFPGCQKLHSEKAALLSSRVIIYLSKQESSQQEGGLLGL